MRSLTNDEREILLKLNTVNKDAMYFREDSEKEAILSLCELRLLCDPHQEDDTSAYLTKITDKGVKVAKLGGYLSSPHFAKIDMVHYKWAADAGRESRDATASFEDYSEAAKVIVAMSAKIKQLEKQVSIAKRNAEAAHA